MRPDETFVGQPVRSLQQMLRTIAETDSNQVSVIPDGIYGNDTMRAVNCFQRRNGLPATGMTDQQTWDAIADAYETAEILVSQAEPIRSDLSPNQVITAGQQNSCLYFCQAMLQNISDAYKTVTPPSMSGVLDIPTCESLRCFQELCDLPATGELDRMTWHHLAKHYPLSARLSSCSPNDRSELRNSSAN